MNPITNSTFMMIANAVVGVYAALESTGVLTALTGTTYGPYLLVAVSVLNGIAHGFSPSTPGPFTPTPTPVPAKK